MSKTKSYKKVPPLPPPPPPPPPHSTAPPISTPQEQPPERIRAPCDDKNYSCPSCPPEFQEMCHKAGGPDDKGPEFKYWKHLIAAFILAGVSVYAVSDNLTFAILLLQHYINIFSFSTWNGLLEKRNLKVRFIQYLYVRVTVNFRINPLIKKNNFFSESMDSKGRSKIVPNPEDSGTIPEEVPYLLIGGGTAAFSAFRSIKASDPTAKV